MDIEEELTKEYFRSNAHKVLVNIIFTSNWILEKMKRLLEEEDITHQQYNILRILGRAEQPLSTLQIREKMLDRMSDTSRIVERMIKKGLVSKVLCSHDKRMVDVSLTKEGEMMIERLALKDKWIDSIVENLSGKEIDMVNTLLDRIREKE